jgi:hypothetical protein
VELETALFFLSIGGFITTAWAWWWLRELQRTLVGHEGFDFIGVIVWVVGWTAVARLVAMVGLFLFDLDRSYTNVTVALSIAAQLIGAAVFLGAALRVRRLLRPPVDRTREAMVELDAQSAGQVPGASIDVGPAVDDRGNDGSSLPAKLD